MEAKISVLLADAGADFRLLLREALERTGEFQVVGETGDGGQVLTLVEETHPQILLLDTHAACAHNRQAYAGYSRTPYISKG